MCGESMIRKDFLFMCDMCGTEVYPFYNSVDEKTVIKEEFQKSLPCERNQELSRGTIAVHSKATGGSKSKGKSKKSLMNKKTTTQLYKELTK